MKKKKILVMFILLIMSLGLNANNPDEPHIDKVKTFQNGAYGRLTSWWESQKTEKISDCLVDLGYSSTTCQSVLAGDNLVFLNATDKGLKLWYSDNYWKMNENETVLDKTGIQALSLGVHWKFEVEPDPIDYDNNKDKYFYQFLISTENDGIITQGSKRMVHYNATNGEPKEVIDNLRCNYKRAHNIFIDTPDCYDHYNPLGDLIKMPNKVNGDSGTSGPYDIDGDFFHSHCHSDNVMWNILSFKFVFEYDECNTNENAFEFGIELEDSNKHWHYVPIRTCFESENVEARTKIIIKENELSQYSADGLNRKEVIVTIKLSDLEDFAISKNLELQDFLEDCGYHLRLYGMTPYMKWFGNNDVNLDYVEMYDSNYKYLVEHTDEVKEALRKRKNDINGVDYSIFMLADEPSACNFDSIKLIEDIADEMNMRITTPICRRHGDEYIANNGESRLDYVKLYYEMVDPEILTIDLYPIKSSYNWNDENSIQKNLERRLLEKYRKYKILTQGDNRELYAVIQSWGEWKGEENRWVDIYQLPLPEMQKCLKLMPLCYGFDGTMDYHLWSKENSNDVCPIKLNDEYNSLTEPNNPRYIAVKEANEKLNCYGKIVYHQKWKDALTIMENGIERPFVGSVYNTGFSNNNIGFFETDKIKVLSNDQNIAYSGYVQIGIYDNNIGDQSYMLVNRRTNFVDIDSGMIKYLSPEDIDARVDYSIAPLQTVQFTLDGENLLDHYGSSVGLYDRIIDYDSYYNQVNSSTNNSNIFSPDNNTIDVPIGPGDGRLLTLCNVLHDNLASEQQIKSVAFINQDLIIDHNLTSCSNSEYKIAAGVTITVKDGALWELKGKATFGKNSKVIVENGGSLNIRNAICDFKSGSEIVVNDDGGLNIYVSTLNSTNDSWKGITVHNANFAFINKSKISKISNITYENTYFYIKDSNINFNSNQTNNNIYIEVINNAPNLYNRGNIISNSSFISKNHKGIGVDIKGSYSKVAVLNSKFMKLSKAVQVFNQRLSTNNFIYFSANEIDNCSSGIYLSNIESDPNFSNRSFLPEISENNFINCDIGIDLINCTSPICQKVVKCDFSYTGIGHDDKGISSVNSDYSIEESTFTKLLFGLQMDNSSFVLGKEIRKNHFIDCDKGIYCRKNNLIMKDNKLTTNQIGLYMVSDCNINLVDGYNTYEDNNISIYNVNIACNIQIIDGYNNFVHSEDYCADYKRENNPWISASNRVDNNYFSPSIKTVPSGIWSNYHLSPSMNYRLEEGPVKPSNMNEQIALARECENNNDYQGAETIYNDVLCDTLLVDYDKYHYCLDGVYRNRVLQRKEYSETADKFSEYQDLLIDKDEQMSYMAENYKINALIREKEYQEPISIYEERLLSTTNEIDSLLAVMDLEFVIELSRNTQSKKPVNIKMAQHKCKDFNEYCERSAKNNKRLEQLLTSRDETPNIEVPEVSKIISNYPNPFNPTTSIKFYCKQDESVKVSVYNLRGQKVKTITDDKYEKGYHTVIWNGDNSAKNKVGSGIYFIRLKSKDRVDVRKMLLMK